MPLNDTFPQAVTFVVGWRTDEDTGAQIKSAIGTAFFVSMLSTTGDHGWIYVVTAAHVVEFEKETWLRVRTKDGGLVLFPVPQWTHHPTADVAVAHLNIPNEVDAKWVPTDNFLDLSPSIPALGDQVYFVGLLAIAESMVQENIPMVRSGTLGRMYQERVPLKHGDGRVSFHQAHLIDCRSYAGFSGSPCFAEFKVPMRPGQAGVFIGGMSAVPEIRCIGLISGHWDDLAKAQVSVDFADDPLAKGIRVPVNTGVGIVTPIERVRECLMDEDLVKTRLQTDAVLAALKGQAAGEKACTADSMGSPAKEMTKDV